MFEKILIANRGEIACRIIRTARSMGVCSVAVYSDADRDALHARMADEAYCVGPAPALKSYLAQENILRVARAAAVQAVHPGYGFLSENPEFAAACVAAGLVFIGPPAGVIADMGIKSRAKGIMEAAGIPVIPGYHDAGSDVATLLKHAEAIGFPLLIKADRGGGGKGIRLVHSAAEFAEAVGAVGREAGSAFGDSTLLLEKHITAARHIEVQIFRDTQGNTVHLFERDCSMQRRHQKIIEEAPAPGLAGELRRKLHEAAVTAAHAVGYVGAGTVEFLVDGAGRFYFMEINTRLQVEHPVTEMVTDQDLVRWQLLVAAGAPLPCRQQDLRCHGHAIEARVYAEDPNSNFMPSSGRILHLKQPLTSQNIRVDSGIREGDVVTPYYDPILAKLIVWGESRPAAIAGMQRSLKTYQVAGVETNLGFLATLVGGTFFGDTACDVTFIDLHLAELISEEPLPDDILACASLAVLLSRRLEHTDVAGLHSDPYSPWRNQDGFRLNSTNMVVLQLIHRRHLITITAFPEAGGYRFELPGGNLFATGTLAAEGKLLCWLNGVKTEVEVYLRENNLVLFRDGVTVSFSLPGDSVAAGRDRAGNTSLHAPIPGNITVVFVPTGATVTEGTPLLVLEAMKMEYTIRAPADGVVTAILFQQGDAVQEGDELVQFKPAAESEDAAS